MMHETHEVGLADTHATTFKSQLPTSVTRVGAALIVYAAVTDVEEVVAYVNFENMVQFAATDGADATYQLTVKGQIMVPLFTEVVKLSKYGAKVDEV